MTDYEREIGATLARLLPDLSAPLLRELLAYGQGMAAANALHCVNTVRDQPETVRAERTA